MLLQMLLYCSALLFRIPNGLYASWALVICSGCSACESFASVPMLLVGVTQGYFFCGRDASFQRRDENVHAE